MVNSLNLQTLNRVLTYSATDMAMISMTFYIFWLHNNNLPGGSGAGPMGGGGILKNRIYMYMESFIKRKVIQLYAPNAYIYFVFIIDQA